MHPGITNTARELFTIRPSPPRLTVALTAGIAMALPLIVFTLAGYEHLGLIASSGGFLSLYLPYRSRSERARVLPAIALILLAGSATAIATAQWSTVAMLALIATTTAVSIAGFGWRMGPPGAVFFIIVSGLSGQLAAPLELGGQGLGAATILGCIAAGLLGSYLVVVVPLALPAVRRADRERNAAPDIAPLRTVRFSLDGPSRLIVGRIAVATAIAFAVCIPLGVHRFYWVLLTITVILQNGHRVALSVSRAIHRVAGTFIGMGIFLAIASFHPRGIVLALMLGAMQATVELVVTRNYGLALLVITPLAMTIASQGHAGDLWSLIEIRLADTVIGSVIALAVLALSLWRAGRRRRCA